MKRREMLLLLMAVTAGRAGCSYAQSAGGRVHRIGYLATTHLPHLLNPFKKGLEELGYQEGRNLRIDYRFAGGREELLDQLAAELVRLGPELIVTVGTPATLAVNRATKTLPIVVATAGDLIWLGLVNSLSQPGGNVTGTTLYGLELTEKRVEVLKEALPAIRRVAVLGNEDNPYSHRLLQDTEAVFRALGLEPLARMVKPSAGLRDAVLRWRNQADALFVLSDSTFNTARNEIIALAKEANLPGMYEAREFVEAGGLISYGPNIALMSYRTAPYVDKILKGAKPTELPVERPSTFELCINLKVAKEFGLTIPPTLLARADEVIE